MSVVICYSMYHEFCRVAKWACNNIQSHISKIVRNILYRNVVQVFGGLIQFQRMPITDDASMQQMLCIYQQTRFHVPMIELYVEFKQQSRLDAVGEEIGKKIIMTVKRSSKPIMKVDDENDDGDLAGNLAVRNQADAICLFYLPCLNDGGAHVVGEGNAAVEDGGFSIGMKFGLRESVIFAIKSYTISREVDYTVYEFEPQTFYAKYKGYGVGLL
ncbi:hypothetical protein Ahy_Scaffold6g107856 [Arachis hypogaea]|uniref:Uncharacterized protein n=1 Tax=Arachis hypogaea TaxID=3818 RepID=A0A444WNR9_ARAHY|nr:hypothetical protein Ahy_Scaffold6g107856 [Arachis hypogaea]